MMRKYKGCKKCPKSTYSFAPWPRLASAYNLCKECDIKNDDLDSSVRAIRKAQKKYYYGRKKSFKLKKVPLLRKNNNEDNTDYLYRLFDHLNDLRFEGKLLSVDLRYRMTSGYKGQYGIKTNEQSVIKIAEVMFLPKNKEYLHYIMLHEMVHHYLYLMGADLRDYSKDFIEVSKRVGSCLDEGHLKDNIGPPHIPRGNNFERDGRVYNSNLIQLHTLKLESSFVNRKGEIIYIFEKDDFRFSRETLKELGYNKYLKIGKEYVFFTTNDYMWPRLHSFLGEVLYEEEKAAA